MRDHGHRVIAYVWVIRHQLGLQLAQEEGGVGVR